MGLIIWLIVGGVIGWLASLIMRTDAQQGIFLNIIVGIIGAFIGGLLISGGSISTVPAKAWRSVDSANMAARSISTPSRVGRSMVRSAP